MSRFEDSLRKRDALKKADAQGLIADSMEYRTKLMERVHAGELTLEEAQKELKKVKRQAKKNGQMTRSQAFSRG